MDTAAIIDEVARITGETDSGYETTILRYLNFYYKELEYILRFPELINDTTFYIPKYYNTGTVSVINGSATVTGSGTAFTTDQIGWFIKIDGEADVHRVTARPSATQLTIASNWTQESLSGKKYYLYKAVYALPADFNKILSVTQGDTPLQVNLRSIMQMDYLHKMFYRIYPGAPRYVVIWKNAADYDNETTTQLAQMLVMPTPDDDYQINVKYWRHLAALTNASDNYPVYDDARMDKYLIDRTCARIFLEKEDDRNKVFFSEAQTSLGLLKQYFDSSAEDDDRFVLQSHRRDERDFLRRVAEDPNIG